MPEKSYTYWYDRFYGDDHAKRGNALKVLSEMTTAERLAWNLLKDISDRCGWGMGGFDDDVKDEIFAAHVKIISETLKPLTGTMDAVIHCLRSYQYGNSATDLAKETADRCEAVLRGE